MCKAVDDDDDDDDDDDAGNKHENDSDDDVLVLCYANTLPHPRKPGAGRKEVSHKVPFSKAYT